MKKNRRASKTTLFYVEGDDEENFLRHIREEYVVIDGGISIHIKSSRGGSSDHVVSKGLKEFQIYDHTYIMFDAHIPLSRESRSSVEALEKVTLLENDPSFDAFLLSISNPGTNYVGKTEGWCKKEFERKYMCKEDKKTQKGFKNIYPKQYLDEIRVEFEELNRILNIMEETMPY